MESIVIPYSDWTISNGNHVIRRCVQQVFRKAAQSVESRFHQGNQGADSR